jgi:hypothetical protein
MTVAMLLYVHIYTVYTYTGPIPGTGTVHTIEVHTRQNITLSIQREIVLRYGTLV